MVRRHLLRAAWLIVSAIRPTTCFGGLADPALPSGEADPSAALDLDDRQLHVCGTSWQAAYRAVHHAASVSNAPRILVFDVAGNGGLADRLTGLMTALLIAVLTDRALTLDWPGYEAVFDTPHLQALPQLLGSARAAASADRREITWLNGNRRLLLQQLVDARGGLEALWPERIVVLRSNRGFTQQLLSSPGFQARAQERHLTPRNGQFGCLFNFLLRPTETTLAPVTTLLAAMRDPTFATVGVHVRAGDTTFAVEGAGDAAREGTTMQARGKKLYDSHAFIYSYAYDLAVAIAANRTRAAAAAAAANASVGSELTTARSPPRGVEPRLLLLGDSSALRHHVAALHDPRHILLPGGSVSHVAKVATPQQAAALSHAVGEHWLYTHAAAFVYSSHSGFPRTAAARSLRDDAIHTCFHYQGALYNAQPTARECTGPYSVPFLGERHAAGL